ncbi:MULTISPECIES: hypothetical protein [unclassified Bradyrhizobium]|uniref:hypothetical protein n=1 Tax=unclassified Bradyrhizobium TaxID=2631580 RepID=UPI002479AC5F|nr:MULTISPECIES: hypothetical protein [unclassified Bradyrhizobium]WGR75371.1 hypothetical protein MTX24_09350 [Bradyrhizobium sp. ISRA426]WGR82998.1 hypothetical protein MTX21_34310 [Bradyrhizobium sp. ISRA430]WGR90575.1 hypothetical protein MTX25_09355 [Bradyrhizobium sp. ISRA432]
MCDLAEWGTNGRIDVLLAQGALNLNEAQGLLHGPEFPFCRKVTSSIAVMLNQFYFPAAVALFGNDQILCGHIVRVLPPWYRLRAAASALHRSTLALRPSELCPALLCRARSVQSPA